MKIRKFTVFGLFVFCFTNIFFKILYGIVRSGKGKNVPSFVLFGNQSLSFRTLYGMTPIEMRPARVVNLCKDLEVNERLNDESPVVVSSYHFYNRSRLCACEVPKAASTSIKRALLTSEYPKKANIFRNMPGYRVHMQKEVKNVSGDQCFGKSATSFLVTRDPYTRLYSAYIDKIYLQKFRKLSVVLDAVFNKGISKDEIKEMTENEDGRWESLFCRMANVSFEQFLMAVVTAPHLDSHFAPVSLLCKPCSNYFDIVLKQETLEEDMKHMFKTIYNFQNSADTKLTLKNYTGEAGIESQILTYFTHWKLWFSNHKCILDKEMYDAISRRLWNGLKLIGSIDENLEFIEELFRGPTGVPLKIRNPETILYEFKANNVPFLNSESREKQRLKYLKQAYRNVDKEVIRKIQLLFQYDFTLFDYDPAPPE